MGAHNARHDPAGTRERRPIHQAKPGVSSSYARTVCADVRSVLSAAVDDELLIRNPCSAKSVRAPKADSSRVVPWTPVQVLGVRAALEERYRATVDVGAGCGLCQGEVFGLAEGALDFEGQTLHVVRQIKHVEGRPVFALPKCEKERDVPLPDSVAGALKAHMGICKPVEVTLPWGTPEGPKVTARLLFTNPGGGIVWRSNFNAHDWEPALGSASDTGQGLSRIWKPLEFLNSALAGRGPGNPRVTPDGGVLGGMRGR